MTLAFEPGDRFLEAVDDWSDQRMMDHEQAIETKAEQALLEIEHLVRDVEDPDDIAFGVEGTEIRHDPSEELAEFLDAQAEESGLPPEAVLKLHVDLFARVFLDDDQKRPPGAPPT
ncbi:hypothetical protein [Halostella pelagica]|uniref:hypothetical protein n=1 Tax=Halostella pelagica TaxID=2583824 RepID=UPI0010808FB3|nr:hypothetical protein [Halostella pelagica]